LHCLTQPRRAHKTLEEGAIKPLRSDSYDECQRDLIKHCRRFGVATDVPWKRLSQKDREWILQGDGCQCIPYRHLGNAGTLGAARRIPGLQLSCQPATPDHLAASSIATVM
jgi:excinuclease UvrABC ATPase subunit